MFNILVIHIHACMYIITIIGQPYSYILSWQKYQEHTQDASLDAVADLLQHTSEMVSLFNDRLYICSTEDNHLHRLNEFHQWISQWAKATENQKNHFISTKLHFDLQSMCLGFQSMVHYKLLKSKMQSSSLQ